MIEFNKVASLPPRQATFDGSGNLVVGANVYPQSNITMVFDYYGPTGMPSEFGMLREVEQSDIDGLVSAGEPFNVKITSEGEIVLNHIPKP
jgi:hypothetical protein